MRHPALIEIEADLERELILRIARSLRSSGDPEDRAEGDRVATGGGPGKETTEKDKHE